MSEVLTAMQYPRKRQFTLLDAMVVIAATAVGLAVLRFTPERVILQVYAMPVQLLLFQVGWTMSHRITAVLLCGCLANLTCALVPRGSDRWRRVRAPGVIACLCVVLVVTLEAVRNLAHSVDDLTRGFSSVHVMGSSLYASSHAVLITWTTLWLVGRWRPACSWPDRLGRLIGCALLIAEVLCVGYEITMALTS